VSHRPVAQQHDAGAERPGLDQPQPQGLGRAATLLDGFGLTTPAAAPVVAQSAAVDAYALTTGRVVGTVAALVALAGVVVGGLALARSAGRISNGGRRGAIVALVAGPTGMVIGGLWWPPPRVVPAPATGSSAALRVSPET
jgi:hypothetical protein